MGDGDRETMTDRRKDRQIHLGIASGARAPILFEGFIIKLPQNSSYKNATLGVSTTILEILTPTLYCHIPCTTYLSFVSETILFLEAIFHQLEFHEVL